MRNILNCVVLLLLYFISTVNRIEGTCVLESDFGFIVNCNFKKSGLFRVRNLGGLKAHFGLGFSLGDELGFGESLGNTESNKRRSLNVKTGANGVYPGEKIMPTDQTPIKRAPTKNYSLRPSTMQTVIPYRVPQFNNNNSYRMTPVTPMKLEQRISPAQNAKAQMTQAKPLPLGVPAFKPIPKLEDDENIKQAIKAAVSTRKTPTMQYEHPYTPANKGYSIQMSHNVSPTRSINVPSTYYPTFQNLPPSISRISSGPVVQFDKNHIQSMVSPHAHSFVAPQKTRLTNRVYTEEQPTVPTVDLKGHTVEELAAAANVSVEVIQQAIYQKQKKLEEEFWANYTRTSSTRQPTTLSTTISTTSTTRRPSTKLLQKKPSKKYQLSNPSGHKVMNAPKEYYPVGYDKNFDDNFTARVDLPHTSFHCGDQKHFPGLYADEELGCMVFHVCALTDNGLIMKSFLCPESTRFDQTILKCNWWFYVDCSNSKSLYDSNLPVSKSYQLMKALSFFSKYKKQGNETSTDLDMDALQNSVNIDDHK